MLSRFAAFVAFSLILPVCSESRLLADEEGQSGESGFQWTLRHREETAPSSGMHHVRTRTENWDPSRTAVIVCDMWDMHHCLNATRRGAEVAPRMDEFLKNARQQGATIIHAPSSCMDFYKDHPGRRRAMETPRATNLPNEIGQWCDQIPSEEKGAYPIDQSDGGEDDDPQEHEEWAKKLSAMGRNPRSPWVRQTEAIEINDKLDYISDSGEEIWSILEAKQIPNVILVGVHTNMCVLGRPFGLRQMARNDKNVVLVRDLTDTMYNPRSKPYVSHFTGTDLIIQHIEKFVCPTITSDQLLGGEEFRFKHDKRPTVLIVMAEREYKTNESLPKFAAEHLGRQFRVDYVHANQRDRNDLPGIEMLADADCLLLSARRRVLPEAQMSIVAEFIESGRPVVGIRTANHAFSLRNQDAPEGFKDWKSFDQDVFGGNYTNHYGSGPDVKVEETRMGHRHEITRKINLTRLQGKGSLYKVAPLEKRAKALLMGVIPGNPAEPLAYVSTHKGSGRAFYTSLGHVDDFAQPEFSKLLRNAVLWATKTKLMESEFVPPGL